MMQKTIWVAKLERHSTVLDSCVVYTSQVTQEASRAVASLLERIGKEQAREGALSEMVFHLRSASPDASVGEDVLGWRMVLYGRGTLPERLAKISGEQEGAPGWVAVASSKVETFTPPARGKSGQLKKRWRVVDASGLIYAARKADALQLSIAQNEYVACAIKTLLPDAWCVALVNEQGVALEHRSRAIGQGEHAIHSTLRLVVYPSEESVPSKQEASPTQVITDLVGKVSGKGIGLWAASCYFKVDQEEDQDQDQDQAGWRARLPKEPAAWVELGQEIHHEELGCVVGGLLDQMRLLRAMSKTLDGGQRLKDDSLPQPRAAGLDLARQAWLEAGEEVWGEWSLMMAKQDAYHLSITRSHRLGLPERTELGYMGWVLQAKQWVMEQERAKRLDHLAMHQIGPLLLAQGFELEQGEWGKEHRWSKGWHGWSDHPNGLHYIRINLYPSAHDREHICATYEARAYSEHLPKSGYEKEPSVETIARWCEECEAWAARCKSSRESARVPKSGGEQ